MIGQTLGHYRITGKLGEGGMGVVYQARDVQLGRDLAVKVLSSDLLHDSVARARLIREAQSAASLNHPNVCTIYEVGESDGQVFIAMELVDGRPLSKYLESGPLSPDEAVKLGFQLSDALGHAHERGLVHRDLKSLNVIVTPDGRCKVLDFGLARRVAEESVDSAAETMLTQPGSVVGTPAYMAPEQLHGQTADARSDVWSLGVVLYEMVTGLRPFQGKTHYQVTSAILNRDPEPIPSTVPAPLRGVIERCLNKEPQSRYRDASEVRSVFELIQQGQTANIRPARRRRLRIKRPLFATVVIAVAASLLGLAYNSDAVRERLAALTSPTIRSVAVLPFDNLSGDPAQDFLADGMTDALIMELSRFGGLTRVIGRASIMRYKDVEYDPKAVAKELNVESLLTGSVTRFQDQVKVNVQLINPTTGEIIVTAGDERSMRDIHTLQNVIITKITQQLRLQMTTEERQRLARTRQVDPEAHEAYLKGMISWYKHTAEDIDQARDYFEIALKKDPMYAEAFAGLAWVWTYRASASVSPAELVGGWQDLERRLKETGLNLNLDIDSTQAEYYEADANADFYYRWEWASAEKKYRTAIQKKPNSVDLRLFFWNLLAATHRMSEAEALLTQGLALDPHNPLAENSYGLFLVLDGRFEEAVTQFRKVLDKKLDFGIAHLGLWAAYHHQGKFKEAYEEARLSFPAELDILLDALERGYKENQYKGAMLRLAEEWASISELTYVLPTIIAKLYAYAGENDKAIEFLLKGYADRDTGLVTIQVDPDWKALRNDPRFKELVRKMKFPS